MSPFKDAINRMTNPLAEAMAHHVKKDEVYTVILNSYDSQQEFTTQIMQRMPPAVGTIQGPDDADGNPTVEAPDPLDPNYTPNNDDLGDIIRDTRKAIFKVDWNSVLPHQYKKFHLETYFISQVCIQARADDPNIDTFKRTNLNTSDGRSLSEQDGYFMKICVNGLSSSNVYDSRTMGRSNAISLVKRNPLSYVGPAAFENRFVYETMSPHLCSPVVAYPSSHIITVEIKGDLLDPIYTESFMARDYMMATNAAGQKY